MKIINKLEKARIYGYFPMTFLEAQHHQSVHLDYSSVNGVSFAS